MSTLFCVFLFFFSSDLSNIKLGSPEDEPEYNDVSWFVMLFACGMGNGLFFYSVFEPIYHYTQSNRYSADPTLTDNQLAQTAILIPMFHFGKHKGKIKGTGTKC